MAGSSTAALEYRLDNGYSAGTTGVTICENHESRNQNQGHHQLRQPGML
jgi:hypothetical protein